MLKQNIKDNFTQASRAYESAASVQKDCAYQLASLLPKHFPSFLPNTILDVGTGTGYLTEAFSSPFPNALYTLNDLSKAMLKVAQEKFSSNPQFKYLLGDIEKIPLKKYDLITSNLCLHWLTSFDQTLKKLYTHSAILAFSIPLAGNLHEWETLLTKHGIKSGFKQYLCEQDLLQTIQTLHPKYFHFEIQTFTLQFPSIRAIFRYFKHLGVNTHFLSYKNKKNLYHLIKRKLNLPHTLTYKIALVFLENQ